MYLLKTKNSLLINSTSYSTLACTGHNLSTFLLIFELLNIIRDTNL